MAERCRHCPRPVIGEYWLACHVCRLRSQMRPATACVHGWHDRCSGVLDGDWDRYSETHGEPCGCDCHTLTFDPALIHPEKHPIRAELLERDLAAWRDHDNGQLLLDLGATS